MPLKHVMFITWIGLRLLGCFEDNKLSLLELVTERVTDWGRPVTLSPSLGRIGKEFFLSQSAYD